MASSTLVTGSTIDEQTRALGLHVRVSMRLGGALVVVWVALLAIQASGDNASLPACEGVYMNQKAGSGFGNHFDGLTDLASVALACGLPMAIESAGLLDAICSRLRCANATRLPSSQNRRQLALDAQIARLPSFHARAVNHRANSQRQRCGGTLVACRWHDWPRHATCRAREGKRE